MKITHLLFLTIVVVLSFIVTTKIYAQSVVSNIFCTEVGVTGAPSPCSPTKGGFVFYCQADPQWQSSGCSIDIAGCGPTSLAMIVSTFGLAMNPNQMDSVFQQTGARACGDFGSSLGVFFKSRWLENNGFEVQSVNLLPSGFLDLNDAQKYLNPSSGYLIIGASNGKTFPCPPSGWCRVVGAKVDHIFVVDGVDPSANTMSVRDPLNCRDNNPQEIQANIIKANDFALNGAFAIRRK